MVVKIAAAPHTLPMGVEDETLIGYSYLQNWQGFVAEQFPDGLNVIYVVN